MTSKNISSLSTAWNKGIRKLFNLHYATHRFVLKGLMQQNDLKTQLLHRFMNSIKSYLVSENGIVKYLAHRSAYGFYGRMGKTVKYICSIYGLTRTELLLKQRTMDIFKLDLNEDQQRICSQVYELITGDLSGFSAEEVSYLVTSLCID